MFYKKRDRGMTERPNKISKLKQTISNKIYAFTDILETDLVHKCKVHVQCKYFHPVGLNVLGYNSIRNVCVFKAF